MFFDFDIGDLLRLFGVDFDFPGTDPLGGFIQQLNNAGVANFGADWLSLALENVWGFSILIFFLLSLLYFADFAATAVTSRPTGNDVLNLLINTGRGMILAAAAAPVSLFVFAFFSQVSNAAVGAFLSVIVAPDMSLIQLSDILSLVSGNFSSLAGSVLLLAINSGTRFGLMMVIWVVQFLPLMAALMTALVLPLRYTRKWGKRFASGSLRAAMFSVAALPIIAFALWMLMIAFMAMTSSDSVSNASMQGWALTIGLILVLVSPFAAFWGYNHFVHAKIMDWLQPKGWVSTDRGRSESEEQLEWSTTERESPARDLKQVKRLREPPRVKSTTKEERKLRRRIVAADLTARGLQAQGAALATAPEPTAVTKAGSVAALSASAASTRKAEELRERRRQLRRRRQQEIDRRYQERQQPKPQPESVPA